MLIDPHDVTLYRNLTTMRQSLNGLLAVEVRNLDELTPAEVALDAQWQRAIEPVLADLYWWPLRNGLSEAPEDEDELRTWLDGKYNDEAVAALLLLLLLNQRRAVNIGGRVGLELIGIGGDFNLSNAELLAILDEHAHSLVTAGTEFSLIDTTINDLVRGIPAARQAATNTLTTLGNFIAGWAAVRSVAIAATEGARQFANGLNWVYGRNGIAQQIFRTRAGACVRICAPLEGMRMAVNSIPDYLRIPLHTHCRCYYQAVVDDWERPESIWRGE